MTTYTANTTNVDHLIHPVYDLLSGEIKELLRDISSGAANNSLIYLYGIYSNGKKTLIDILKRIVRVVEITDDLVDCYYHQGYMDCEFDLLKKQGLEDSTPQLFVNIRARYDMDRYYESHSFRLWLKKYNIPVIIVTRFIPCFTIYPELNDLNVKLIRMKNTFESEYDPTFKEWITYVTEDGRLALKPVLDKSKIIDDEAVQIVSQIMKYQK